MVNVSEEALARQERSPIAIGSRGILITTHQELWSFAQHVAKTEFVPKEFRNDPGSTMVALEYALELGLPMLQGLQNIMVVNGRPSIWGDLMLAMVEASGLQEDFVEDFEGNAYDDDFRAVCITKRRGRSKPTIATFSVLDAKIAKLWGNPQKPIWQQYPKRQLQMRARGFALRDTYPDIFRGLHSREEMEDAIELVSTGQGFSVAVGTEGGNRGHVPDTVVAQLEPPPAHPTLEQVKGLLTQIEAAGVAKERRFVELRALLPRLAEGHLTQKYLVETLTLPEYEEAWDHFTDRMKAHVESDVTDKLTTPPSQEPPESTIADEGIPEAGDRGEVSPEGIIDGPTEEQMADLKDLAESLGPKAEAELASVRDKHRHGLPLQAYQAIRNALLAMQANQGRGSINA